MTGLGLSSAPSTAGGGGPAVATRLLGVATATPPICWEQATTLETLGRLWRLGDEARGRWERIIAGSGVRSRYGVLPLDRIVRMSTGERMAAYEQHAAPLAVTAARAALERTAIDASRITDLIVVSCTGFSAPGVDVELVRRLGLRRSVRRTVIGFMGCFGAISGLRAAVGRCAADRGAVTLVVCVELCSLHLRDDAGAQNMVASALFGDGAAAAIVAAVESPGGDASDDIGGLTLGRTRLLLEGHDWMTWKITDHGFAMTLSRAVPAALRAEVASFAGGEPGDAYVVHPGGPAVLAAIDDALQLEGGRGIEASRHVLDRVGNTSSSALLFVLERMLRLGYEPPLQMLAFGPGLTIESLGLT